ncbi:MAG: polyphosphate:AMP phosphotransferase [Pseudomonadota bacterium]
MAMDASVLDPMNEAEFKARETVLRESLLDAQFDLAEKESETILVLLNGPDGAGKGQVLNRLHSWLDPRAIKTMAYDIEAYEEVRRPGGWRYWRDLPAYGEIGVVLGSWYHYLLHRRALKLISKDEFTQRLDMVDRIETMLTAERVRTVKIWLKLSAGKAAKSVKQHTSAAAGIKNPLLREWRSIDTKGERKRLIQAAQEVLDVSAAHSVLWHEVPALDPMARDLAVGELLLGAMREAIAAKPKRKRSRPATRPRRVAPGPSRLQAMDLSLSLEKSDYRERLKKAQDDLYGLTRSKAFRKRALVCVFEGNDAAGKGGAIKRLRSALDPVHSSVISIAAPDDAALAHPYLWRFWQHIPDRGDAAIFDRSWYGRVLVERVEGFAAPADWRRAYDEINDFEELLSGGDYIVHKFWLSIDPDEQLRRFEERKVVPHKRFKITDEDWRNREKWPAYAAAVEDMIALTSTRRAPWTLVEANDKRFARVKVIETLVARLKAEL